MGIHDITTWNQNVSRTHGGVPLKYLLTETADQSQSRHQENSSTSGQHKQQWAFSMNALQKQNLTSCIPSTHQLIARTCALFNGLCRTPAKFCDTVDTQSLKRFGAKTGAICECSSSFILEVLFRVGIDIPNRLLGLNTCESSTLTKEKRKRYQVWFKLITGFQLTLGFAAANHSSAV